jgi:hypothetical protein
MINGRFPQLVETLINKWGSPDLTIHINDFLSDASAGLQPDATGEITAALASLKAEHDQEYPHHASQADPGMVQKLTETEKFQKINSRFPHIGRRLMVRWGHASLHPYINELMNDHRGGRQGFPEGIALALFELLHEHDREFPRLVPKDTDIWSVS